MRTLLGNNNSPSQSAGQTLPRNQEFDNVFENRKTNTPSSGDLGSIPTKKPDEGYSSAPTGPVSQSASVGNSDVVITPGQPLEESTQIPSYRMDDDDNLVVSEDSEDVASTAEGHQDQKEEKEPKDSPRKEDAKQEIRISRGGVFPLESGGGSSAKPPQTLKEDNKESTQKSNPSDTDTSLKHTPEKSLSSEKENKDKDEETSHVMKESAEIKEPSSSVFEDLISAGQGWAVVANLKNLESLPPSVAEKLIEFGQGWAVAKNLDNFNELPQSVAEKLIQYGQAWAVAQNFDKFTGLSDSVAQGLMESGQDWYVAKNLDKFDALPQSIAVTLIQAGRGWAVIKNLDAFSDLEHQTIALRLVEFGDEWAVAENLDKLRGLSQSIADSLIESGKGSAVVENLHSFSDLDHKSTAKKLIEFGQGGAVAQHLGDFEKTKKTSTSDVRKSEPEANET